MDVIIDVDIHAIDAAWAMQFGHQALDKSFTFNKLKPMLVKQRAMMVEGYQNSVQAARALELEAYDALITDKRYASVRRTSPQCMRQLHARSASMWLLQ